MIVLITPTGARPDQFKLCAKYMKAQTYKGEVLWIIVDDADPKTTDVEREGWTIQKIYPLPAWKVGQNTQGRNIKAGIDQVPKNAEAIFIIEDDDYYSPQYLEEMMKRSDNCLAWGESHTIYYNVKLQRWIENQNDKWSSLFQTAFKPGALKYFNQLYGEKFIDYAFFRICPKVKLFKLKNKLSVGMKGIPGRAGIGAGHGFIAHMAPDPTGEKLIELLGTNAKNYDRYSSNA